MDKKRIKLPIIVEGRYDKAVLSSVFDCRVFTTDGFGIFKKKEKLALFRALAQKSPIIVLTDPDGAGTLIRAHIGSAVPPQQIIPLYVPQIKGVEKRKSAPSAAGVLGVEGQERALLYELLLPFSGDAAYAENPLSKAELYEDRLTGCADAADRRDRLCAMLGLPEGMTPNALLAALRVILDHAAYKAAVDRLDAFPTDGI